MKKLLLLLLLCPFTLFAKFYEGTITLKSGTVKTGLVELPKHSRVDKISFKVDKKVKVEKIDLSSVEEFTIINEDKKEIRYITLKLAMLKTFKVEYKMDEEVSWVRVEEDDYISIVLGFIKDPIGTKVTPVYFLHKEGNDYCEYIAIFYSEGVAINEFANIRRLCEMIFKDDCPSLSEKLTKDAYKKDRLRAITYLYNELCAK